jgi:hypothetical protein
VRISCRATPGAAGFRCRSHIQKPYARVSADVHDNSEPVVVLFTQTLCYRLAENTLEVST